MISLACCSTTCKRQLAKLVESVQSNVVVPHRDCNLQSHPLASDSAGGVDEEGTEDANVQESVRVGDVDRVLLIGRDIADVCAFGRIGEVGNKKMVRTGQRRHSDVT